MTAKGEPICAPKSWVLEASSDGADWGAIDRRNDNAGLNGPHLTKTLSIAGARAFRMIRLRQTGKNHNGRDSLCLNALEVFGGLIE